ncbi:cysteine peptidase family C39 domain-containing protein [Flavobacterium sp.]|uniref:cysteine peptidase family C39 domain-containing protein n=1 Tax=Flavobacterium sp. TaxID=239 RepID=UPI002487C190|nr:cysteine peptidase family C39 domain-containing protein [Flavobacterium sp.]MDI1317744.1 cysteine peptidase family C39 domain-containing protein [Flavobacterium sp.]
MLNEEILNTIKNKSSDGGIDAILSIIQFYKGNSVIFDLQHVVNLYDSNSPYEAIEKIISNFELESTICTTANITEVKTYAQPIIINLNNKEKESHFVVCKNYDDTLGFRIEDPINGNYYASEKGLESMWKDKKCITFASRLKKTNFSLKEYSDEFD